MGRSCFALQVSGYSTIEINKDLDPDHIVQIDGHVNFVNGNGTSGDGEVYLGLTNKDSYLNGSVYYSESQFGDLGCATPNSGLNMTLANGAARYVREALKNSDIVTKFTLNSGIVDMTALKREDEFDGSVSEVSIYSLSGEGRLVIIPTMTAENENGIAAAAHLTVASATNPDMAVEFDGFDPGTFNSAEARTAAIRELITGINIQNKDSEYAYKVTTPEGDVLGALTWEVSALEGDAWHIANVTETPNQKLEDLRGLESVAFVDWRQRTDRLNERMGDVRHGSKAGVWARLHGSDFAWGDERVDINSRSVQVGATQGDAWDVAIYAMRRAESGGYISLLGRAGYMTYDVESSVMDTKLRSVGVGLSAEAGHTFEVSSYFFVEPQLQVAYGYLQGKDSTTSNGVHLNVNHSQTLTGRAGVRAGVDLPKEAGSLWLVASAHYDALGDVDAVAFKDEAIANLHESLGGAWVSYGLGADFKLGENGRFNASLGRTTGGEVSESLRYSVGVRWLF